MDKDEVLALFDREMRREARPNRPGARVERDGGVVRQVSADGADGGWVGVLWSDLDRASAPAAIAAQVAHFTARGQEFEWKLYSHDRPADLGDRLTAAGFTPEPAEALMVARTGELPTAVEPPEGVRLVRVTDPAGVDLVAEVHEEAFGSGAARVRGTLLKQLAEAPESVVAVVAMAGDRPVSAARMELAPGTRFAGLWGGGTAAPWRGRGIYRALIAYRAAIAAERGYDYLQVDASDQSRPILQRLGFTLLATTTPYLYRP
ncbi:GNAT superfamily N-acetyltransferase [Kitasatospora sp. MAA4]|uniref:GNAT family N-acetyltransferase n=1 Tax=Kitasatospora sp. MAA4 TaxID=3035093 RepID=UPI00247690C8|nr:GNAT family N-acetyltransferase [Kitasatospora sp. MAA4]MDH6133302.1 GNAT superfamily N-acetyltransferase [Kitasatospora sp. MAA4]